MSHARTANLLGPIALDLADNILDTAKGHVAHGGRTPAAHSVIGHEPGQSIDFLAPRAKEMKKFGVAYQVDNNTVANSKRKLYVDLERLQSADERRQSLSRSKGRREHFDALRE